MPCQSDYHLPTESEERQATLEREVRDNLARMLCEVCKMITVPNLADRQVSISQVPGLKAWWVEHQRRDAEEAQRLRRAAEIQAREEARQELAKQALNKLTSEEQKALGL